MIERAPEPLRTLLAALRNFLHDNSVDRAATVSFYSLLSLGPIMLLVGELLSWVVGEREAMDRLVEQLSNFVPPAVADALPAVLDSLETGGALVWIAVPALVWVGSSAVASLEYAISVAFGTVSERRFWRARLKTFGVVGGGLLLLIISVVANTLPGLREAAAAVGLVQLLDWLSGTGSQLLIQSVTLGCFAIFYKFLPRGRVRWSAALTGALLALVLWDGARRLFGAWLAGSPAYGVLTGTLAGTVAFLLWIYASVAVILLGAELAALRNGNRRVLERPEKRPESNA